MQDRQSRVRGLIDRGFVVIPVAPGEKTALVKWGDFKELDRQSAIQQMHEIFDGFTAYDWHEKNFAVVCGKNSGVMIVDIDVQHMPTFIDPAFFLNDYLEKYPTDFVVQTPRGGWHLYYQYPEGEHFGNSRGGLPTWVDVRGQGGYALVEPSIVGGKAYRTIRDGLPGVMPATLKELLRKAPATEKKPDEKHQQSVEKLSRILRGEFTPGQHNEEILWAARYMRGRGFDRDTALELLLLANDYDDTPQSRDAIVATCNSAFDYVERTSSITELLDATASTLNENTRELSDEGGRGGLYIMDAGHYDTAFKREQNWLIKDWLPRGYPIMLVGHAGSRKTWFHLDMAVSISLGQQFDPQGFLGKYPVENYEGQNVLIFQQEDDPARLAERIELLYNVRAHRQGDPFHVQFQDDGTLRYASFYDTPGKIYFYPAGNFSFEKNIREVHSDGSVEEHDPFDILEWTIAQRNVSVVIFDPLYSFGSSENYFVQFTDHLQRLKGISLRRNCSMLLVHHTKKATTGNGSRMNMWGSALLDAASSGQWQITDTDKQDDDGNALLEMTLSGKSFGAVQNHRGAIIINSMPGHEEMTYVIDEDFVGGLTHGAKVYNYLVEAQVPVSASQISRDLELHSMSVARVLTKLVEGGRAKDLDPEKTRGKRYMAIQPAMEEF